MFEFGKNLDTIYKIIVLGGILDQISRENKVVIKTKKVKDSDEDKPVTIVYGHGSYLVISQQEIKNIPRNVLDLVVGHIPPLILKLFPGILKAVGNTLGETPHLYFTKDGKLPPFEYEEALTLVQDDDK